MTVGAICHRRRERCLPSTPELLGQGHVRITTHVTIVEFWLRDRISSSYSCCCSAISGFGVLRTPWTVFLDKSLSSLSVPTDPRGGAASRRVFARVFVATRDLSTSSVVNSLHGYGVDECSLDYISTEDVLELTTYKTYESFEPVVEPRRSNGEA